ncbi:polysaccharide export outer membrane protein [Devosia crocina]|uniref:Polysaccharide export outer membrane protein n=1 Tax=Devosia crocina TaxID=429728 RepID=A0A1I7MZ47_9HYPH|nr:polysaccharide biosynthesis/export family protein [Devosia crocina]SFV27693.1 polysaccharide export outer membrane protein [Devosia crocina]
MSGVHISVSKFVSTRHRRRRAALLAAIAMILPAPLDAVHAADLWPQTRISLKVIQWIPLKGIYEQWEAISGDYVIGSDGSLTLPVIGTISTSGKDSEEIASEIALSLREQLGLVKAPDTSVDVVDYPQIYVVGDVSGPGSFDYRPGMTVLQALALGGGQRREQITETSAERVKLATELRMLEDGLLRSRVRLARLKAEASGEDAISFPPGTGNQLNAELARSAMADEAAIFAARKRELARQLEALDELGVLLNEEIATTKARLEDVEKMIATATEDLRGIQALVEKGLSTSARRSELERQIADMRFEQLTQTTAILRAQQALSQAKREAAQLQDSRQSQAAVSLQEEQANIDEMVLRQASSQRLLLDFDVKSAGVSSQPTDLHYSIVRSGSGSADIVAQEATNLLPGDVLKVSAVVAAVQNAAPAQTQVSALDEE